MWWRVLVDAIGNGVCTHLDLLDQNWGSKSGPLKLLLTFRHLKNLHFSRCSSDWPLFGSLKFGLEVDKKYAQLEYLGFEVSQTESALFLSDEEFRRQSSEEANTIFRCGTSPRFFAASITSFRSLSWERFYNLKSLSSSSFTMPIYTLNRFVYYLNRWRSWNWLCQDWLEMFALPRPLQSLTLNTFEDWTKYHITAPLYTIIELDTLKE